MGATVSAASKFLKRKEETISPAEEAKKAADNGRRRNSLAYNIVNFVEWQEEEYTDLVQQVVSELPKEKPVKPTKKTKIGDQILQGNMFELRNQVVVNWQAINNPFSDVHHGNAILHMICQEGYYEMVNFACNPASHSEFDPTPLQIDIRNNKNRTPLMLCFTPPSSTFLGQHFGVDSNGNPRGNRPLVEVDSDWIRPGGPRNREKCVVALVDRGAKVNERDFHDFTVLHYAAIWGWVSTVQVLLERGANINAQNIVGKTALMYAVDYLNEDLVDYLCRWSTLSLDLTDSEGGTALILAAEKGTGAVPIMAKLIKTGADIDAFNHRRKTPLKIACAANDMTMVHMLLDNKCARRNSAVDLLAEENRQLVFARFETDMARELEEAILKAEEEKKKLDKAAVDAAALNVKRDFRNPVGAWRPFVDKFSKKLFYYNSISRKSQFEVPPDYAPKKGYIAKDAMFGLHFYH